jgi:hypothetical protein
LVFLPFSLQPFCAILCISLPDCLHVHLARRCKDFSKRFKAKKCQTSQRIWSPRFLASLWTVRGGHCHQIYACMVTVSCQQRKCSLSTFSTWMCHRIAPTTHQ